MTKQISLDDARSGDLIEVVGHAVTEARRSGEILEVLGAGRRPSFRVRWEDDHVSVLFPGSDVVVSRARRHS
jgi:uncharacterized protein DUF1918